MVTSDRRWKHIREIKTGAYSSVINCHLSHSVSPCELQNRVISCVIIYALFFEYRHLGQWPYLTFMKKTVKLVSYNKTHVF